MDTTIDLDIRLFKRYPRRLPLDVTLHGRHFRARTTDFSPHGLGLIIEGTPSVGTGDELVIMTGDLHIHETARVAWKKEISSGLRLGVQRTGSPQGLLSHYRVSDLLIGLQRTLKTGILDVVHGAEWRKVFFRNGNPVFASSSIDRDRLGDIFLKRRVITKAQFEQAAEVKRETGQRYAVILVNLGFVTPHDLVSIVKIQVKRIIGSLFLMRDGTFTFTEGPLPIERVVPLNISIAGLLYRTLKKHADIGLVREHLLSNIVDFSSTPLNLFQDVRLSKTDREIVGHVDGKRRIGEIVKLSRAAETETLKSISALLEARILEVRTKSSPSTGLRSEEVFEQPRMPHPELIRMIEQMRSQYETLGYYGVLGLDPSVQSEREIRKAYYRAAKQYHPDRHFGLPEDMKAKLIEIFAYITNAYITLSNPVKRADYDGRLKAARQRDSSVIIDPPASFSDRAGDRAARSEDTARSKFKKGLEEFWQGRFEEASLLFARAIYFDRSVPDYHYYYGRSLLQVKRPKEAVSGLRAVLELSPNNPDILAELGHAYLQLGFPIRSRGYFDRVMKIQPGHKRAAEGLVLLKKKR